MRWELLIYNKKWTLKYKGEVKETNLSKKINISPEISQILNNRGIENEKDAEMTKKFGANGVFNG